MASESLLWTPAPVLAGCVTCVNVILKLCIPQCSHLEKGA